MDNTLWTDTVITFLQVSYENMGGQNSIVRGSTSVQVLRWTQGSGLSAGVVLKGEYPRRTNIYESVFLGLEQRVVPRSSVRTRRGVVRFILEVLLLGVHTEFPWKCCTRTMEIIMYTS